MLSFNHTNPMALGAQLTASNPNQRLSFDIEPPMGLKSSSLEGLWWSLDEKTTGQVMLSNTTDGTLDVNLNVEWRGIVIPAPGIAFSPHQTKVIEIEKLLKELGISAKGIERGGLSITHNGTPGALTAYGFIQNEERGFSSNLSFVDPAGVPTSALDGAGLFLARSASKSAFPENSFFTPQLALKNASKSPQIARVTVWYKAGTRTESRVLPAVNLVPHQVQMVDFNRVLGELRNASVESAGVKITHNGQPGSLVAALSSVDQSKSFAVDVPLVSRIANSAKGGTHPFLIDENTQSVAYITNTIQKPTKALVIIFHSGGLYTPELIDIEPGATVAIDIGQLRDSQAKDVLDRTLPEDLSGGQFLWRPHGGEALIGRIVVFDKRSGTASNFSCPNCCIQEPSRLEIIPLPLVGLPGSTQQLTAKEYDRICELGEFGPYDVTNSVAYSTDSPSIATVNPTGRVSYISVGSTMTRMSLVYYHSDYISAEDCGLTQQTLEEQCPTDTITVRIKQGGTDITNTTRDVIVGQQISLTGEIMPATAAVSNRQWAVPGNRIANYVVTYTSTTSPTSAIVTPMTNLSGSTVDFYWVNGQDGRQVQYTVTVGGRQFTATATFNVKRPTAQITTTTGTVARDFACGGFAIRYGCDMGSLPAGITFSRTITIPSGFSGSTQWLQLVSTTTRTKLKTNGTLLTLQGAGLLDTDYPFDPAASTDDSPRQPFGSDDDEITVNETFTMWLMFRPSQSNSIWVPLRKLSWSWAGKATLVTLTNVSTCQYS